MPTTVFDFFEFAVFIFPRSIQVLLGVLTQTGWITDNFAFSMYLGLTYVCSAALTGTSLVMGSRCVFGQVLVISRETTMPLTKSLFILCLAGFTAAAPTTGLSLKYCAKAAADFIRFADPHR